MSFSTNLPVSNFFTSVNFFLRLLLSSFKNIFLSDLFSSSDHTFFVPHFLLLTLFVGIPILILLCKMFNRLKSLF